MKKDARKYFRNSFITERQIQVLKIIRETGSISEAAKKLEITEGSVYGLRKKLEQTIERAIVTLEIAQELRLLDEERMAPLMKGVY